MSEYSICRATVAEKQANREIDALLRAEGIKRDANLDYTCAMYDADYNVVATGSCFGNTLRCMAVSSAHQGEGLMNEIVSHLMEHQFERGNSHLFLYTKCSSAMFFASLGFYEIQRIDGNVVFMENRKTGFADYLADLRDQNRIDPHPDRSLPAQPRVAAIVMNANPFTNGHLYLVEKACAENDLVHLFMISEDASLVPFAVRKQLILEGTAHLGNIIYHESGPYIISSSTFPSYFQKDENAVIEGHALLDLSIFAQIAKHLGVTVRYVGEEPTSVVTGIYNRIMQEKLPEYCIGCVVLPRKACDGRAISASTVRVALRDGDWATLEALVPETTCRYFRSEAAVPVLARIRAEENVVHY